MKKIIEIVQFGIKIEMDKKNPDDHWGGTITSTLKCSPCDDSFDEVVNSMEYNLMMDGLEAIILAHALAGINVTTPLYVEGIQTACDACAKHTE